MAFSALSADTGDRYVQDRQLEASRFGPLAFTATLEHPRGHLGGPQAAVAAPSPSSAAAAVAVQLRGRAAPALQLDAGDPGDRWYHLQVPVAIQGENFCVPT